MRRTSMLTGALAATVAFGGAQALDDSLCDFEVEGLSLASTREEIAAKFEPLGWHDLSEADHMQSNGVHVSTIVWDRSRTSNDMPPPGFVREPGRFQMIISAEGHVQSAALTYDDGAGVRERALAFCALFDDRFEVSGCSESAFSPSREQFGVTAHPKNAGDIDYCQVRFSGDIRYGGWSYSVSRHAAEVADTRGGVGRGRGRGQ